MKQRVVSKLVLAYDLGPETSVLASTGEPIASGKGDMDLACGGCGAVLVHGLTATEVALQYKVPQLVIKCQCGGFNALTDPKRLGAGINPSDLPRPTIGPDQAPRIAEAAYYRAEKRGFAPGHALEDWLAAEAQVDSGLNTAHPPRP